MVSLSTALRWGREELFQIFRPKSMSGWKEGSMIRVRNRIASQAIWGLLLSLFSSFPFHPPVIPVSSQTRELFHHWKITWTNSSCAPQLKINQPPWSQSVNLNYHGNPHGQLTIAIASLKNRPIFLATRDRRDWRTERRDTIVPCRVWWCRSIEMYLTGHHHHRRRDDEVPLSSIRVGKKEGEIRVSGERFGLHDWHDDDRSFEILSWGIPN